MSSASSSRSALCPGRLTPAAITISLSLSFSISLFDPYFCISRIRSSVSITLTYGPEITGSPSMSTYAHEIPLGRPSYVPTAAMIAISVFFSVSRSMAESVLSGPGWVCMQRVCLSMSTLLMVTVLKSPMDISSVLPRGETNTDISLFTCPVISQISSIICWSQRKDGSLLISYNFSRRSSMLLFRPFVFPVISFAIWFILRQRRVF